jgi:hypothetical protein
MLILNCFIFTENLSYKILCVLSALKGSERPAERLLHFRKDANRPRWWLTVGYEYKSAWDHDNKQLPE